MTELEKKKKMLELGRVKLARQEMEFKIEEKQVWRQAPTGKALTVRQNQGIHIKFATNSANGSFNIRLIFTVE